MSQYTTMNPEQWERVQQIFHLALDREGADRSRYLRDACGSDVDLRAVVDSMLAAHDSSGGLSGPIRDLPSRPRLSDHLDELKTELSGRYAVERILGLGGMATVYLAVDQRHGRPVAIKLLHPEFAATLGADRFLREIRIASTLRHPHILPLYDSGEAAGSLYYVMPVESETLRHRLARDYTLPLDDALTITREILDALQYAHEEGVVHRDVKPENVLFSQGHAIIADFGIARAISAAGGGRQLTAAGLPLGTPAYMSPEQLAGDPRVDGRSDLYSVGCLLYEMLTGGVPFAGNAAEPLDLGLGHGAFPVHVEQAIRRALCPRPEDRFSTAAELSTALSGPLADTTSTGRTASRRTHSIAVLPFANLSPDPENEYFSDGVTEEIINALTQVRGLRVAARTSSFVFKNTRQDVTQIGARLRVGTVLEGSVRRVGRRLRIAAQLVDVTNGYQLWSERYDREIDDVFEIQDEIARTIANRLAITLAERGREPLVRPPTTDMDAYQCYLKGRHLWNRRTKDGLHRAIEFFQKAIERDTDFAPAYAGLADAYLLAGSYSHLPRSEAHVLAKTAAEHALSLDDRLAEAHTSRGQVLRAEREWRGEEQSYRRAIELNPSYATAHQWYATLLAALGRSTVALREIRLAEELDPLSHAIGVTVAVVQFLARDYQSALHQLRRTLDLEPTFASVHAWLGGVYAELGEYEQAARAVERAAELSPDNPNVWVGLAYACAKKGDHARALEIVERARARGAHGWPGIIYAQLGDLDRAFECLTQAVHGEDTWDVAYYLKVYPWADPLRSDSRYDDLLREMKLPE